MKNIIFLNASPKVNEDTASGCLITLAAKRVCPEGAHCIDVRQSLKGNTEEDFAAISRAGALVVAFPLYTFCLPGILTRYLEDYSKYVQKAKPAGRVKVYPIVNCGFPEPDINLEAVRVIKSFCTHVRADFRFGIMVGGGGMVLGADKAPFMKKTMKQFDDAFTAISQDLESNTPCALENIQIKMNVPRKLYLFFGNRGWYAGARKNGLKKNDLYKKPYAPVKTV